MDSHGYIKSVMFRFVEGNEVDGRQGHGAQGIAMSVI